MKITNLQIENVKRVKAVELTPTANGLTVIGGKNGQGKTSVLDAIAWALGGDRFKPDVPERDGSVLPPFIRVTLDNGIIVERKGKNSALKVIDPSSAQSGQQLLNSFIEQLALDLPRFMQATDTEKAKTLLKVIGVGDELTALDSEEQKLYNERLYIGRIAEQKKGYAAEMQQYDGVPEDIISASELIQRQQDILARNGENQRKRQNLREIEQRGKEALEKVLDLREKLQAAENELEELREDCLTAQKTVAELRDEATDEIERSLADIDAINVKVRANLDREKALDDAHEYIKQYDTLTAKIEKVRDERKALLDKAELPLPELTVENGVLKYKGYPWGNLSGSEQLRVATAIVRKLNPKCGFVLMDGLEVLDNDTLREFGDWLDKEKMQVIATRVSTGNECSIIISDGEDAAEHDNIESRWKPGVF